MQVSKKGLVKIFFNQDIDFFRDLWLELKGEERRLSAIGVTSMEDFLKLFTVELVPENDSDDREGQEEDDKFSWEIFEVTKNSIQIQLTWNNPEHIS